ncbi:ATP-binding cassette domain-containing protein [Epidermidibacterium keratini]|uniref:ATP-binding cassette domain-containing protein n=1 Tax=Epidermidibacterium keratini TaxID=1891644 RepID=A0A7L4YLF3_9ACTN|nr:ABC transporter ATP-binding protein [Epidermidibacterium keratini]QHB99376.1 ATP-binding cassette domain-containing protein [Epidermidibacterium keratini]
MNNALEVSELSAGYDRSQVLFDVSLQVPSGQVLALLGRNGVGKSTLVNAVAGLVRPTSGSVRIFGTETAGDRIDRIAKRGVGLVPQGRRVFAPLTVAEHLQIAERAGRKGEWTRDRVVDLLPRLGERLGNRGDQLSGGEQQMLAIARALLTNPTLMLLDEPSDGLAPSIVTQVGEVVRELCATGISVLLVEQDLHLAFSVADRVVVLDKGTVRLDTTLEDFRSDHVRARALLGV